MLTLLEIAVMNMSRNEVHSSILPSKVGRVRRGSRISTEGVGPLPVLPLLDGLYDLKILVKFALSMIARSIKSLFTLVWVVRFAGSAWLPSSSKCSSILVWFLAKVSRYFVTVSSSMGVVAWLTYFSSSHTITLVVLSLSFTVLATMSASDFDGAMAACFHKKHFHRSLMSLTQLIKTGYPVRRTIKCRVWL